MVKLRDSRDFHAWNDASFHAAVADVHSNSKVQLAEIQNRFRRESILKNRLELFLNAHITFAFQYPI